MNTRSESYYSVALFPETDHGRFFVIGRNQLGQLVLYNYMATLKIFCSISVIVKVDLQTGHPIGINIIMSILARYPLAQVLVIDYTPPIASYAE